MPRRSVPGFLLAGLYVVYVTVRSFINPKLGPPVPKELRAPSVQSALEASSAWCRSPA